MATWFDESRLDDETALATIDLPLRSLAESEGLIAGSQDSTTHV